MKCIPALLLLSAGGAFAQTPVINQILNNYGLVNSGTVAQGAIFIVKGSNLSDQTTALQSVPLQTTLQGVTIRITVGGVTTQAPMYYVLPQQLAGILPSNTPTGTGTLVVTNNGRTSAAAAINVVRSGFGALALNGAGTGGAAVHDASYNLLSNTNATNPGNAVIFYGSGVGPTTGDETVLQEGANASGDLTSISISVQIGGKAAQVLYRGRTSFPGVDQINVVIPTLDAATYSCAVTVVITTNNVQANVLTIPVAASGSTCIPPNTGGGGNTSTTPTQSEIGAWSGAGTYKTGTVGLLHTTGHNVRDNNSGGTVTTMSKTGGFTANFSRLSGADVARSLSAAANALLIPTAGQCSVLTTVNPFPNITIGYLDAGPSINSSGPNGAQIAVKTVLPTQLVYLASNVPNTYIAPGRYTFSGQGGPDVGAFSGTLDLAPELVWTNTDDAKVVTRANGLPIQWTGGDPTQLVTITGQSFTSPSNIAIFFCWANNSAGQFTVPANILNQLPASNVISAGAATVVTRGVVNVYSMSQTRLAAPGMDYLVGSGEWSVTVTSQYK